MHAPAEKLWKSETTAECLASRTRERYMVIPTQEWGAKREIRVPAPTQSAFEAIRAICQSFAEGIGTERRTETEWHRSVAASIGRCRPSRRDGLAVTPADDQQQPSPVRRNPWRQLRGHADTM